MHFYYQNYFDDVHNILKIEINEETRKTLVLLGIRPSFGSLSLDRDGRFSLSELVSFVN